MSRFADKGGVGYVPDAMASLALVRALTTEMIKNGMLRPEDIEYIKQTALKELGSPYGDAGFQIQMARDLVQNEYP